MLHIPILRHGRHYESVEKTPIVHHATGKPEALVSQANSGLIVRDLHRMDARILEPIAMADLLAMCRKAADLFMTAPLPLGDPAGPMQSFEDYVRQLSATTGMPVTYCRDNAGKIRKVLAEMEEVLAGLTRGLDLSVLDRGYGTHSEGELRNKEWEKRKERTVSFYREGRILGAVLPSNSPGVHSLWMPAIALKTPIALKPGREEPWTPLRIIEALAAAGVPREAFGFYPTDHAGAGELLRHVNRGMIFGDSSTTRPWADDPRIEIHGPGYSKVILGPDKADDWPRYIDLMLTSIAANGGRSCINASAVWTPRHGHAIARALAERLAKVEALPAEDPRAQIAAFADPNVAARISAVIDQGLLEPGAEDVTDRFRKSMSGATELQGDEEPLQPLPPWSGRSSRGLTPHGRGSVQKSGHSGASESSRLVRRGPIAYLLPTIIDCGSMRDHPLANREFLFPYAAVVECPAEEMAAAIGPSLIVSAITQDRRLIDALTARPNIDRLNLGPIPTPHISWDQPHEGNLFELLYRQRAFQMAEVI